MGLGASIITFTPGTTIHAADVNSNFTAINNATNFTGSLQGNADTATSASGTTNLSTNGGTIGLQAIVGGVSFVGVNGGLRDYNGNKYQAWSHFGGTGSGTYSHLWAGGVIPNQVDINPINNAAVSWATNAGGTTTVGVNLSAAVSFNGDASFNF